MTYCGHCIYYSKGLLKNNNVPYYNYYYFNYFMYSTTKRQQQKTKTNKLNILTLNGRTKKNKNPGKKPTTRIN